MIYEGKHADGKYWKIVDAAGDPIPGILSADSGTGELVRWAKNPDREGAFLIEIRDGKRQVKEEVVIPAYWRIVHKVSGETVATWP